MVVINIKVIDTRLKNIIIKAIDTIAISNTCSQIEAFVILLDYMAYRLNIPESMLCMKQSNIDYADKNIDFNMLKLSYLDVLGSIYESLSIGVALSDYRAIRPRIAKYVSKLEPTIIHGTLMPTPVLDECAGTGRMLIELYKIYGDKLMYYGVEDNIIPYKICLVNMGIYNIPSRILYSGIDSTLTDFSAGSKAWENSNKWR